ncbi:hypothetical protein ACKFKG_21900 [Phormidesmis sp. 146-35]
MIEPLDHSDRLSRVQAIIITLRDLTPDGDWSDHPLFRKWQKRPYSLTTKEFGTLERHLERHHRELVQQTIAKNYIQIDLFGGGHE